MYTTYIYLPAVDDGSVLVISLKAPAHTLLPSIPPSSSHEVTVRFSSACDPSQPSKLVLGAAKQTTKRAKQAVKAVKQSRAINCVPINQNKVSKQAGTFEISPIEVPSDTPAQVSTGCVCKA